MTTSSTPVLEPLGVGEQLDAGFRLWRPQFGRLYLLSLALTLPVAVITFAYDAATLVQITSGGLLFVDDPDAYQSVTRVLGFASIFATLITVGAIFSTVTRSYVGEDDRTLGQILAQSLRRSLPFVGMTFAAAFVVGLGVLALLVPGIILAVSLSLAFPAFWAEETKAIASLSRAWKLIKGRRWQVFGVAVVTTILSILFNAVLGFISLALLFRGEVILYALVANIVAAVWSAAIIALVPIMVTVAYYDCRVRNEGFDLELASSQLGSTAGTYDAGSATIA